MYQWMRANQPVFRDRNGLAAASTYQAVIDAERQPELFSNAGGIRPGVDALPHMIDMDDPAHLLRRKLVNAGFTRKRVRDREASIAELVDTLIDAVCERGECDFVRDLAAPLPMAVIGDMLGVRPEQRQMLLKWSDDLVCALSSTIAEADWQAALDANAAYTEFTLETIAARRKEPTDDLTSVLVHAEVDGERLTDEEIVSETLLILIGGDETTRHTLSGAPSSCCVTETSGRCCSVIRIGTCPGDRGDAALDVAGEEHVPNPHRGHRVPRHPAVQGREDDAALRVRQLRRIGIRRTRTLRHHPKP
ncbi:putative cytochrome P450 [Mycobacterium xenopi 3993]|nr:putative cytochrome P450 [Mycobacterium xenopi 3993]